MLLFESFFCLFYDETKEKTVSKILESYVCDVMVYPLYNGKINEIVY